MTVINFPLSRDEELTLVALKISGSSSPLLHLYNFLVSTLQQKKTNCIPQYSFLFFLSFVFNHLFPPCLLSQPLSIFLAETNYFANNSKADLGLSFGGNLRCICSLFMVKWRLNNEKRNLSENRKRSVHKERDGERKAGTEGWRDKRKRIGKAKIIQNKRRLKLNGKYCFGGFVATSKYSSHLIW